jgi:hypothetical protein
LEQPGGALAERVEERHFILIGHVEVAVTADTVKELMHGVDGRPADKTQGRLIEVDALTQSWIVRPVEQRRRYETPPCVAGHTGPKPESDARKRIAQPTQILYTIPASSWSTG